MNKVDSILYETLYERPWNIEGGALKALHNAFTKPSNLELEDFFTSRPDSSIDENGIMTIHVVGVLGDHPKISKLLGNTDYKTLIDEFKTAQENANGVLLMVNSPGGQSQGNLEVAEAYANLTIPKVAYVDGLDCSAAYKISVGSDYLISSPSSLVGSIGTILPFVDQSKLWENYGIKPDYIVSGDLKGAGMPPSLSDEHRQHLQELVNDLANSFKAHVRRFRSVSDDMMQGQAVIGSRALENNLVDELGTIETAYNYLLKKAGLA